jgi:serine phosphatase RsbU (regulator of sigma subunit)
VSVKPLWLRITPPDGAPFEHECAAASLVLGREKAADLSISDPYLSRQHARLFRDGDAWFLESLTSKSTTLLNGRPIRGAARVGHGDEAQLGNTRVRFQQEDDPAPAPFILPGATTVFRSAAALLQPAGEPGPDGGGDALRRLTGRLELVNEVYRGVAGRIALDDLLQLLLDRVFDHLAPEDAAIFLKGPDGELRPALSRRPPGATGEPFFSRSLAREVAGKGMAALVQDAIVDDRFASADSIVTSGVRSIVAAPLLDAEGSLGMIVLISHAHVRRFSEEDLELLVSLASAVTLRIRTIGLAEQAAQHRLLEKEIELARDIQMGMLPTAFPARPEFALFAALRPARSVGGDLYDFLDGPDRLWFFVGDVSGKGFPAALHMAVTRTLFRAAAPDETSPAALLGRMNRELSRDNERAVFVTGFAGRLDLASGEIAFSNAGHNRPYVMRRDGSVRSVVEAAGMAMGVDPDFSYPTGVLSLAPGDTLYLYTDGVTEALDAASRPYGEERLEERLRELAQAPVGTVVQETLRAVQEFAGSTPQSDDIAVMAVRYLAPRG